jgi:hypothetical protein
MWGTISIVRGNSLHFSSLSSSIRLHFVVVTFRIHSLQRLLWKYMKNVMVALVHYGGKEMGKIDLDSNNLLVLLSFPS